MPNLDVSLPDGASPHAAANSPPAPRGNGLPLSGASLEVLVILGIALAVRIAATAYFWGPIDTEGAEYARIAQNLRWGNGYAGIATPGTQLFFPPLFPWLIWAVSLLTGNELLAGRIISIAAGSIMALPVAQIGARLHGRRVGLIAAWIVALHPFLIRMSTTVHCEMLHLALLLGGLHFALAACDRPTRSTWIFAGALFGLAYLVRAESLVQMLAVTGLIVAYHWLTRSMPLARLATGAGLMLAAGATFALPYLAWLSWQTGQFRIEGKSPLNIATVRRIQQGEDSGFARYGIDDSLQECGVWNQPNATVIRAEAGRRPGLSYFTAQAGAVAYEVRQALTSGSLYGSPTLLCLAILGLFARPWNRRQLAGHLQLMAVMALSLFGLFFIYYTHSRFFVVPVALLCLWAASGAGAIGRWLTRTVAAAGVTAGLGRLAATGATILACLAVIGPAAGKALAELRDARGERPLTDAARWLTSHARGPIRLAAVDTVLSFESKATHIWLPHSSSEAALEYLRRRSVNYVLVRDAQVGRRTYLEQWSQHGIPHERAHAAYHAGTGGTSFTIYELDWSGTLAP